VVAKDHAIGKGLELALADSGLDLDLPVDVWVKLDAIQCLVEAVQEPAREIATLVAVELGRRVRLGQGVSGRLLPVLRPQSGQGPISGDQGHGPAVDLRAGAADLGAPSL
jgi:hypothetical protein